jgi:hypothetical protein
MSDKIKNFQHFAYPINGKELKENTDYKTLGFPDFELNKDNLIKEYDAQKNHIYDLMRKNPILPYEEVGYETRVKKYLTDKYNLDIKFVESFGNKNNIPIEWDNIFILEADIFNYLPIDSVLACFIPSWDVIVINNDLAQDNSKFAGYIEEMIIHEFFHKNNFGRHLKVKLEFESGNISIIDYRTGWVEANTEEGVVKGKNNFFEEGLATIFQSFARMEYDNLHPPIKESLVMGINKHYKYAMNSIYLLENEIPGLFSELKNGRTNVSKMLKSIKMIEEYCKGLFQFIESLQISEFESGFKLIEKIAKLKKENFKVKVVNGEIIKMLD